MNDFFTERTLKKKNLFLQLLFAGWGGDYSFRCQPVDYSDNPKALLVSIKEALVLQPHTRILIAAVFLWSSEKRVSLAPVHFYFLSSLLQFQMLHACYMYYLSKFTEFIDTVSKKCDKRLLYSLHTDAMTCHFSSSALWPGKSSIKFRFYTLSIMASCPSQSGPEPVSCPAATLPSLDFSTPSSTLSCTSTT